MFRNQLIPLPIFSAGGCTSRTTDNIKYHYSTDIPRLIVKESVEAFQVFDGSPGSIMEITDAYFVPGAMCLYDRHGVRIAESCIRRGKGLVEFLHAGTDAVSLPTDFITINEPLVYMSWLSNHWGDFLTEGTSRLWALLQYPELATLTGFYLPSHRLHKNITDFIKLLDLNIRAGGNVPDRPVRFRRVFIPTASFSNRGEAYSVHRKPASAVIDCHLRENNFQVSKQPVFLSRSRFGGHRNVQNQAELESALARKGFLIVYPEELSLAEQIMLFNQHRHFWGCWGSAFHSAILSRSPGSLATHVICHCAPNANFLMFDSILGNDANYVESMFLTPGKQQVWPHLNLTIDVEQVLSYYEGIA
jgi:hypothetical protein